MLAWFGGMVVSRASEISFDSERGDTMPEKVCPPDDAAWERLFGRVKNKMYRNQSWQEPSILGADEQVNEHIRWHN